MNKIEVALHLAKDCTYADEMTEGAKKHLRDIIDEALMEVKNNIVLPDVIKSVCPVCKCVAGTTCAHSWHYDNKGNWRSGQTVL